MLTCPDCDGDVRVSSAPLFSEILECGDCSVELEIIALDPVMVVLAPEVEEDWGE